MNPPLPVGTMRYRVWPEAACKTTRLMVSMHLLYPLWPWQLLLATPRRPHGARLWVRKCVSRLLRETRS